MVERVFELWASEEISKNKQKKRHTRRIVFFYILIAIMN